jgi:hypothetical protein
MLSADKKSLKESMIQFLEDSRSQKERFELKVSRVRMTNSSNSKDVSLRTPLQE